VQRAVLDEGRAERLGQCPGEEGVKRLPRRALKPNATAWPGALGRNRFLRVANRILNFHKPLLMKVFSDGAIKASRRACLSAMLRPQRYDRCASCGRHRFGARRLGVDLRLQSPLGKARMPGVLWASLSAGLGCFFMASSGLADAGVVLDRLEPRFDGEKMMQQPQVETGEVTYEGLWADDAKSVQVFRGIAYAAPPVGALRFRPPVPSPTLKGLFRAQTDPTACWQAHSEDAFVWSLGVFPRSEDCLYLNVWTPAAHRISDESLPVMVWFHGGGHNQSWGHHPLFDGSSFTDQNVILVTVNYRLGPWGFLALPMLAEESSQGSAGNYGLLDKLAALQWVQNNIAAFGGDIGNVTVFGQSAGSQSICALMASPLSKGLFHKAIGQSASCLQAFDHDPKGFETGSRLLEALGGINDLKALRSVSNEALLAAAKTTQWAARSRITIDGWVLPEAPLARFLNGQALSVPLMVGSLANEGHLLMPRVQDTDAAGFQAFLTRTFAMNPAAIPEILKAYQFELEIDYATARHEISTDLFMAFSMRLWASLNQKQGAASYIYFMSHVPPACRIYRPEAPELLLPSGPRSAGAYHSGDLAYVFNTMHKAGCDWNDADHELARVMNRYWINFAKRSHPNGGEQLNWPAWSETGEVMVFDGRPRLERDVRHQKLKALAQGLDLSLD